MLVHQLGHGDAIPDAPPSEYEHNEDFLKSAHHILMEVCKHVVCSHTLIIYFPFKDENFEMQYSSLSMRLVIWSHQQPVTAI